MKNYHHLIALLSLFIIFLYPGTLISQSPGLDQDAYVKDFDQLAELVKKAHVRPFWKNSKLKFEQLVQEIRTKIQQPNLNKEQILCEYLRLIASIQDGHSSLSADDRYREFGYLPITAEWFGDELHIIRAHPTYAPLLGGKITAVNEIPIQEVLQKLKPLVPHANVERFKKFSPYYLHLPGLLYGLGISQQADKATFSVSFPNGQVLDMQVSTQEEVPLTGYLNREELPLYLKDQDKAYWFTYFEKEELLYLNINRVTSMKEESIWSFCDRLFRFVEEHPIQKFVVDIRENGGGNMAYAAQLWNGIIKSKKINAPGRLFVITGHKTFSAAIVLASRLEQRSNAIFVGERVCDHPIHPGDSKNFELPNTGIKVKLSQLFHETSFFQDERTSIEPDIAIFNPFQYYAEGRDKVMEYIVDFKYQPKNYVSKINKALLGSYVFSPYENLVLKEKDGRYWISIDNRIQSPLYAEQDDTMSTEINGLKMQFAENQQLTLFYPDGKKRKLEHQTSSFPGLYVWLKAGMTEPAMAFLQALKNKNAPTQIWKDHALSQLALDIFMDLKEENQEKARQRARAILEMAIQLNPENHEFATFSLQFY